MSSIEAGISIWDMTLENAEKIIHTNKAGDSWELFFPNNCSVRINNSEVIEVTTPERRYFRNFAKCEIFDKNGNLLEGNPPTEVAEILQNKAKILLAELKKNAGKEKTLVEAVDVSQPYSCSEIREGGGKTYVVTFADKPGIEAYFFLSGDIRLRFTDGKKVLLFTAREGVQIFDEGKGVSIPCPDLCQKIRDISADFWDKTSGVW